MARLLKSEIYAEINAHLCGLKHLDKGNKYKTQLDELEKQNKHILLNSLPTTKLSSFTIGLVRLESFW